MEIEWTHGRRITKRIRAALRQGSGQAWEPPLLRLFRNPGYWLLGEPIEFISIREDWAPMPSRVRARGSPINWYARGAELTSDQALCYTDVYTSSTAVLGNGGG